MDCVAAVNRPLEYVAVLYGELRITLTAIAVRYFVMQHLALCCSVLQRVAVRCGVLQRVVVLHRRSSIYLTRCYPEEV